MNNQQHRQVALEGYLRFFNHLDTELPNIAQYVSEDVRFQDPFNRVENRDDLKRLLQDFCEKVSNPRFECELDTWNGNICFIRWQFSGHLALIGEWRFPGVSELHFGADGKVQRHIDYWDAGQHFYGKLPFIGRLIGFIRRRAAA